MVNRTLSFFSTLLLVSSAALAQSTVPVGGCPVAMRAQPGTGAGMMVMRGPGAVDGVAQRLHVTLTNQMPVNVVGVTILVHGLTNVTRMTPTIAHTAGDASGKISRMVQLDLSVTARKDTTTDLVLDAFTSVSRIDLLTVSYQDGSVWQAETNQACHIAPDGFMLVASR